MFDRFASKYKIDRQPGRSTHIELGNDGILAKEMQEFFSRFGGSSFNDGVYRVHSSPQTEHWNSLIAEAFPEFAGRISSFGYDWLGRQFTLDLSRNEDGQPGVLMFEPGTGEALEVPANLASFHDSELVRHSDAALASDFYSSWLRSGGTAPQKHQCCGYIKPLFLGGTDDIENLELTDMRVYWGVIAQVLKKLRNMPPGTPVGSISIR